VSGQSRPTQRQWLAWVLPQPLRQQRRPSLWAVPFLLSVPYLPRLLACELSDAPALHEASGFLRRVFVSFRNTRVMHRPDVLRVKLFVGLP